MTDARQLYLSLLKRSLLNMIYGDHDELIEANDGMMITRAEARLEGLDWPRQAFTMIGMKRLDALQYCVERSIAENIPGDLIETGVWRGGASILMRGVLAAYGDRTRTVWVADSFQGLPRPDAERFPQDHGLDLSGYEELRVSRAQVEANFERYGLLDEQVIFLEGWFKDTLPEAPMDELALIRLDGDLYESTLDALTALYPKLSPGGYIHIDDFGAIDACRHAVTDYREQHEITDPIHEIDWTGVYWRKT